MWTKLLVQVQTLRAMEEQSGDGQGAGGVLHETQTWYQRLISYLTRRQVKEGAHRVFAGATSTMIGLAGGAQNCCPLAVERVKIRGWTDSDKKERSPDKVE